jgi:hypothetical protein
MSMTNANNPSMTVGATRTATSPPTVVAISSTRASRMLV